MTSPPASYTAMLDMTSLTIKHGHIPVILSQGHGCLQTKCQIALVRIVNDNLLFNNLY